MPVECPSTVGRSKIGAWNSDPRLPGIQRINQLLGASEFVLGDSDRWNTTPPAVALPVSTEYGVSDSQQTTTHFNSEQWTTIRKLFRVCYSEKQCEGSKGEVFGVNESPSLDP
jgi:hypothetical protein